MSRCKFAVSVGLFVMISGFRSAEAMTDEVPSMFRVEPISISKAIDSSGGVRLQRVHALTHAKTISALDVELRDERKLIAQRALCDAELRSHSIPGACFWVLRREKELHLIHPIGEIRDSQWLEHLCISRATSIRDLDESSLKSIDDVPLKCRSAIQSRVADLRYQFETSAPEKLFRQHYQQMEIPHED